MARLIDADAIEYTTLYNEDWFNNSGREEQAAWKSDIDALPTIEERKPGRWKKEDIYSNWHDWTIYFCSECGSQFRDLSPRHYCPNCGCRMMEVEND